MADSAKGRRQGLGGVGSKGCPGCPRVASTPAKARAGWLQEIDRQIRHVERQTASDTRDRRLRQLKHRRRQVLQKSTEPGGAANRSRPVGSEASRTSAAADSGG